jgi:integrase
MDCGLAGAAFAAPTPSGPATDESQRKAREASDFLLYLTREGYADFHALRHTMITRTMDSGVMTHHAQGLARHSDPKMTMRYSHTKQERLAQALQQVPPIPSQPGAAGKSAAVG